MVHSSVGDSQCFLFRLKPNMGVYQPTGYNENYMYLNMGMQTMPNGLVRYHGFDNLDVWHCVSQNHTSLNNIVILFWAGLLCDSSICILVCASVHIKGPHQPSAAILLLTFPNK